VHGLVPELHGRSVDWGRLADWDPANWALVLLATSLPVGSIYFGSDLVAKVLHHRPAPAPTPVESTETDANRSTADLEERPEPPVAPVEQPEALAIEPVTVAIEDTAPESERVPVGAVAAEQPRIRRATGRVPAVARSSRPARTAEELLSEAREATAGWSVEELTAEGIRKAVRTSPAKARVLRETLRGERAPVDAEPVPEVV
jgi:hypothetical protein